MANYRAIASGNWSNGATWAGGAVPPDAAGHNIYSNGFTVTIDQNINVALLTNASITASFVGGGTSAAREGKFIVSVSGLSVIANITHNANASCLEFTASAPHSLTITGNITGNTTAFGNPSNVAGVLVTSTGTLNIYGNIVGPIANGANVYAVSTSSGTINIFNSIITSSVTGTFYAVYNNGGSINIINSILNGTNNVAVVNNAGTIICTSCVFNASTASACYSGAGSNRLSGTFVSSTNGRQPISSAVWFLNTTPTNSYIQQALDGINASSFVRYYTADNALGQANPTDVRSGVSYASGNLTGRLTVPARGSVALSVNYGPSMPFTATVSGTTATATLAYSYQLVVGDTITVTGASNTEWNSTYTIASVVSGTSVTFVVPATHSATAGTGALMQTTGTAVLDPAAVASAVWGAATRSITGGTVDTLTNAPTVPSASAIASQVRTELTTELANLDATVSSRLATSGYTAPTSAPSVADIRTELAVELGRLDASVSSRLAGSAYTAPTTPPTAAEIAIAVEGSLLNEGDGQQVLNAIVGAIGNTNLSEVSLVAAVRADLERNGGKLDSIPTTSAPSASAVAGAVRTELGTELGRIDAAVSTRLASASYTAPTTPPTAAQNASAVRTELSTELGRVDAAVSTRLSSSAATDLAAVKAKTDLLNTDRLANVATTNIVGTLLAQSQS
jgi:hypothetical protein